MDMDNASWAMDQLRAATEEHEQLFTVSNSAAPTNNNKQPNLATTTTPFVSQFRIDGQPILPPLMTAERRRQMQLLKQRALELETKYKQADKLKKSSQEINSSCCSSDSSSNSMNSIKLQQTQTFIYDLKQDSDANSCLKQRPQTLSFKPKKLIPTICVNPPTPQQQQLQQAPKPPPIPTTMLSKVETKLNLNKPQRKINNITGRIMRFEGESLEEPPAVQLLYQNKDMTHPMLRSSTSPALNASLLNAQQMQRSRSFTLEEPSQALKDHMKREEAAGLGLGTAQSLAHLRRDTVESKAKQVQRSLSSSCVSISPGRRCGGHVKQQQQQQQLKQLLQLALHEANDVLDSQQQLKTQQLTLAKRQMFKDIKSAHRDRFQQLVQYQHEEQRRMQAEFDRQQKFLIEQICADINVSAYAPLSSEPQPSQSQSPSPSGISEYTSTDDLPTPNPTQSSSLNDTFNTFTSTKEPSLTARKRLFDMDTESDVNSELLPMDSSANSSPKSLTNNNSNKARIRKPIQRNPTKNPTTTTTTTSNTARKVTSPLTKSSPARRVHTNNNKTTPTTTTTTVAKSNPRHQSQQQSQSIQSKTRQSRVVAKK